MPCVPCDLMKKLRDELMESITQHHRMPEAFRLTQEQVRLLSSAIIGKPSTLTKVFGVPIVLIESEAQEGAAVATR